MQDPKKKKLAGRPKINDSSIKKHNFTIRLSDNDLIILDEKVRTFGFSSYSSFLRETALSCELLQIVPEVNISTYLELGRIGSNFNQMLKLCHQGALIEIDAIIQILTKLQTLVQEVRKEVRCDK